MPKPRRRRWWIIAAILTACVVGASVGLYQDMYEMHTYAADLTKGSGPFDTTDNPWQALFYRADGYHLVAKSPGFTMTGVNAPTYTAVAAVVTVRAVKDSLGAAFGPYVQAHFAGNAYWLGVDSVGTATLNEMDLSGNKVVASAKAPPLSGGTTHTLMLTYVITDGTVRLAGYVDGTRVISGTPTIKISSVARMGMVGYAGFWDFPEWVATRFARLGPDDMPKG